MVFEKGGSLDLKIDQRVDVARVYRPRAKRISGKPRLAPLTAYGIREGWKSQREN